jgi:hypothetical protein
VPASSEPYIVSWGSLWWIFWIGCAIYLAIVLCFKCLAACDNTVFSVFRKQALKGGVARLKYDKSADDSDSD